MVLPEVTTLAEAQDAIRELAEENEKLSNELAWFRRQLFGSKTEHYIPEDNTPSLFPEEESPEPSKEVPTATVAEHERKVRQANALSEIPADLPREERVIDVPEEEREGMILIGYDESERIAFRTGLYVIHFKRAKYADPSDALRGVVTAPAPGDVFDSVSGTSHWSWNNVCKCAKCIGNFSEAYRGSKPCSMGTTVTRNSKYRSLFVFSSLASHPSRFFAYIR